ncbi:N-acetylmuramoyl-L-alanine amidase [candidate division KSB1 bacterium]|nr:N-acetylmuramoyl-L-alanine amidase [candidate division KSB1 bacterium]
MKIALDPGHGGIFPGAIGLAPFELREKDVTLAICTKMSNLLKKQGHKVILTRERDLNLDNNFTKDLRMRAALAMQTKSDVFVSVHCNAYSDPNPEGIETWYRAENKRSETLARTIQQAMAAAFSDHLNRGVKAKDLLMFRHLEIPACHIETEYLTNPTQLEFLASDFNQEKIAQALTQGILNFAALA